MALQSTGAGTGQSFMGGRAQARTNKSAVAVNSLVNSTYFNVLLLSKRGSVRKRLNITLPDSSLGFSHSGNGRFVTGYGNTVDISNERNGSLISSFGSYGEEPGAFDYIYCVNAMPDFICVGQIGNVQFFNYAGTYISHIGSFNRDDHGFTDGNFSVVSGVTFTDSEIFVGDWGVDYDADIRINRVQVFTLAGAFSRSWQFSKGTLLTARDSDTRNIAVFNSEVFVAHGIDFGDPWVISVFDLNGTFLREIATNLYGPGYSKFTSSFCISRGILYVTGATTNVYDSPRCVDTYQPDGTFIERVLEGTVDTDAFYAITEIKEG